MGPQNCLEAMKMVIMLVGKPTTYVMIDNTYLMITIIDSRSINIVLALYKVFHTSSSSRNDFEQPIIAQWIRINPTRWADRISLRVEFYGCQYIPDVLYFNGKAMIQKEIVSNFNIFLLSTILVC